MRAGKDVVGLPLITRDNGTKVGKVRDLILNQGSTQVLGVLVEERGLVGSARVIPWSSVQTLGLDAVIIDDEASVKKASELPEIEEVLEEGFVLRGRDLQTTKGLKLGKIDDAYFDPNMGTVHGFGVSAGRDKQFLPVTPSFQPGKDVVFIDPSAELSITGLKEALKAGRAAAD
jgi:uncharacterized protein YrrD